MLIKVAKHKLYRGTISYILADWPDSQKPTTMQVQVDIHSSFKS